jgi:hypothetical protein
MSNVGDAFSGSDTSGNLDQTFSDATLGDQMQGGSGDIFGSGSGDTSGGPGEFSQTSDLANALSSGSPVGSSPAMAQAASLAPPGAAAATGGDPVGAASGTQSSTTPGSTPDQQSSGGRTQNQPQQGDQQYAPKSATDQLKALLKQLSGKPAGPTGQLPTPQGATALPPSQPGQTMPLPGLARGQTGPQSPQGQPPNEGGIANLPNVDAGETGAQSPGSFYGTPIQPQAPASPVSQVAGAPPAEARVPPDAAQGRDITVQPRAGERAQAQPATQAMPAPQNEPGEVAPGGPALPTRKPTQPPQAEQPAEQPAAPPMGAGATPRILQDISGASTGSPTALADLAQAARILLPLAGMLFGGGGGGGRRFGRFHGGRFTHGVGGFRGGHPGAFGHPAWRGAWPYHHPQFGWDMHHHHPGGGWLPMNPADMQGLTGGQQGQDPNQQGGPDPNQPPKETGAEVGPPSSTPTSGAIPGVGAKDVDDYTRQAASKWGIDPNVASKFLGQESSYGQARRPGDNGTSFGPFQLHFAADGRAMGDDFRRDTGLDPRDPSTWKAQVDYAMKRAAMGGWGPWQTTMNKLGYGQWSGITTNRQFAGQPRTNQQPKWATNPNIAVTQTTLPPSSQPMVAGGP